MNYAEITNTKGNLELDHSKKTPIPGLVVEGWGPSSQEGRDARESAY